MSMSEEDKKVWRQFTESVKPLKSSQRVHHKSAAAKRKVSNHVATTHHEIVDEPSINYHLTPTVWVSKEQRLTFAANGIQKRVMQRLKRGQYPIMATLDLHGYTTQQAAKLTEQFLRQAWHNDDYCLRIIHGKGLSTTHHHAVLKSQLNHWLKQHPLVLAFCSAPDHDGGGGALYVLIRRHKRKS